MRSMIPCYFEISHGQIQPTYEIVDLAALNLLMIASLHCRCAKITILPEFTPNTYMLEKHADKGEEPWQIYAWCVRDLISKYSGIPKLDEKLQLADKLNFEALMNGVKDRVQINGQVFEYDNDTPVQQPKLSSRVLLRRLSTISNEVLKDYKETIRRADSEHGAAQVKV